MAEKMRCGLSTMTDKLHSCEFVALTCKIELIMMKALSHASNFPQWLLTVSYLRKFSFGLNGIFPHRPYRTSWTVNKVNYDSFYTEFLIHGGFIFLKRSWSRENDSESLWDQAGDKTTAYIQVNLEARKHFW